MTDQSSTQTNYVIAPREPYTLPIKGSDALFPVNRVFCIGRNYAAHAAEMGHDPNKEPPFFFFKHASTITTDGVFPYPTETSDVHYEVEMVVAIGRGGDNIAPETALDHVWGYGVGIDMTRRDLQAQAKKLGRPWEVAKSFEKSAPCGPLVPASEIGHPATGGVTLSVDGQMRQQGDLNQLLWSVPDVIAVLSRYFTLVAGDIIMTGTPSGVGPIERGQTMEAQVKGVGAITVKVV